VLCVSASYRLRRLTRSGSVGDPYKQRLQLTQSLIAIGRGQWLGVGLAWCAEAVLSAGSAHDFLFAVLAEELGLLGVL